MPPIAHRQNSYSLWLRPNQEQINEVTKIISELSHRFNSTPFPPRITLLSSISADTTTITGVCEKIIDQHSAFDIALEQIEYSDNYFRNLYIPAKLEQPLVSIFEKVKNQLNDVTQETFTPHVSLYYGKLIEKKQQTLKEELDERFPKIFNYQRLDLYYTSSKESEWYLVKSFNLKTINQRG